MKTKAAAEIQSVLERQATLQHYILCCLHNRQEKLQEELQRRWHQGKQNLGSFFKKTNVQQPCPVALSNRDAIEVELKSYLQALGVDGEADPLEWWRQH